MFKFLTGKVILALVVIVAAGTVIYTHVKPSNSSKSESKQLTEMKVSDKKKDSSSSDSSSNTDEAVNENEHTYYSGNKKVEAPILNGSTETTTYWTSTLTIKGKKMAVLASYSRQGFFSILTKKPMDKDYSFTYDGLDYRDYFGKKNLDSLAAKSTYFYK